jgi:hypothetical protein
LARRSPVKRQEVPPSPVRVYSADLRAHSTARHQRSAALQAPAQACRTWVAQPSRAQTAEGGSARVRAQNSRSRPPARPAARSSARAAVCSCVRCRRSPRWAQPRCRACACACALAAPGSTACRCCDAAPRCAPLLPRHGGWRGACGGVRLEPLLLHDGMRGIGRERLQLRRRARAGVQRLHPCWPRLRVALLRSQPPALALVVAGRAIRATLANSACASPQLQLLAAQLQVCAAGRVRGGLPVLRRTHAQQLQECCSPWRRRNGTALLRLCAARHAAATPARRAQGCLIIPTASAPTLMRGAALIRAGAHEAVWRCARWLSATRHTRRRGRLCSAAAVASILAPGDAALRRQAESATTTTAALRTLDARCG